MKWNDVAIWLAVFFVILAGISFFLWNEFDIQNMVFFALWFQNLSIMCLVLSDKVKK